LCGAVGQTPRHARRKNIVAGRFVCTSVICGAQGGAVFVFFLFFFFGDLFFFGGPRTLIFCFAFFVFWCGWVCLGGPSIRSRPQGTLNRHVVWGWQRRRSEGGNVIKYWTLPWEQGSKVKKKREGKKKNERLKRKLRSKMKKRGGGEQSFWILNSYQQVALGVCEISFFAEGRGRYKLDGFGFLGGGYLGCSKLERGVQVAYDRPLFSHRNSVDGGGQTSPPSTPMPFLFVYGSIRLMDETKKRATGRGMTSVECYDCFVLVVFFCFCFFFVCHTPASSWLVVGGLFVCLCLNNECSG